MDPLLVAAKATATVTHTPRPTHTPTPSPSPSTTDSGESTWHHITTWVSGAPLHIILIVVLAFVARYFANHLVNGVVRGITVKHERPGAEWRTAADGRSRLAELSVRRTQRAETMGSILRSVFAAVIFGIAFCLVLGELGIDLAPIIATAGIAGIALGFGAQTLVKDFLSGVFMIVEDQYGVGDVIDTGFATGTVEDVGLRVTQVRDATGVVWYVRNGEILRIGNRSQGWSLATVDMPIAYDEDIDAVRHAVAQVGQEMLADDAMRDRLLEPPVVVGVESVTGDVVVVRVTARSAPQENLTVARELRERLKTAFDTAGIRVPVLARPYQPPSPPRPSSSL